MVAAEACANLHSVDARPSEAAAVTVGGVGWRSVESALRLLREGPDLAAEVKAGTKTVVGAISELNSRERVRDVCGGSP